MGFTAAEIFAPNVPDKLDPIRYLTTPAQSKAQEQAQAQARSLGFAKLHGIPPTELERVTCSAESRKPAMNSVLSKEERQEFQDKKTAIIPNRIIPPPGVPGTTVDYPYMFTNVRVRNPYQFMEITKGAPTNQEERKVSHIGKRQAPIIHLSEGEFDLGSDYIDLIKDQLAEFGIVKLNFPNVPRARIPFGPDFTGFTTAKQVALNPNTEFDYRQIKRGFFRALIRFHTTMEGRKRLQRFPTLEKKPVDYYRLFHAVELHGGADKTGKRKGWAQVGRELGYSSYALPTLSSTLRQIYSKVLQPFKEWLVEHAPGPIDASQMPRLDVDDHGNSQWHRLPNGIVIDMSTHHTDFKTRRNYEFEETRSCPPNYTLKLFRQWQRDEEQDNAESPYELEKQYSQLPEWYETEYMHPRIPMIRYPAEALTLSSSSEATDKFWDPWDMTSLAMRENQGFLPYIVDQGLDELLLAEMDVAAKFATSTWHRPRGGAYEVNMLVDGQNRTWYTKDGTWVDQSSSEVVIVHPNAEVLNWSHGYSALVSTHVLLDSDWLLHAVNADLGYPNAATHVCVQQIVYKIAESCDNETDTVPAKILSQAIEALDRIKRHELNLLSQIQIKNSKRVDPADAKPIRCEILGKQRYFAWIEVDNKTLSIEGFLLQKPTTYSTSPVFVSIYDASADASAGSAGSADIDVEDFQKVEKFFNNLHTKLKNGKSGDAVAWAENVDQALSVKNRELPKDSVFQELIKDSPGRMAHNTVSQLHQALYRLRKWIDSGCSTTKFFELVDCSDDGGLVQNACAEISKEKAEALALWEDLYVLKTVNYPNEPDTEASKRFNDEAAALLEKYSHCMRDWQKEALGDVPKVTKWARDVFEIIYYPPQRDQGIDVKSRRTALNDEGYLLSIPDTCAPRKILRELISSANDVESKLKSLLKGPGSISPARMSNFKSTYIDPIISGKRPEIDPKLMEEFLIQYESLPTLERMGYYDVMNRPKRSEVSNRDLRVPQIHAAVVQLEEWLVLAKDLDWVTIATQLGKMMAQELPAPPPTGWTQPISVRRIIDVYSQLFQLKILPDDLESVKRTFENTINVLTRTPFQIYIQYGFGA